MESTQQRLSSLEKTLNALETRFDGIENILKTSKTEFKECVRPKAHQEKVSICRVLSIEHVF